MDPVPAALFLPTLDSIIWAHCSALYRSGWGGGRCARVCLYLRVALPQNFQKEPGQKAGRPRLEPLPHHLLAVRSQAITVGDQA